MASLANSPPTREPRRTALVLATVLLALPVLLVLTAEPAAASPTWRLYATREGLVGGTTSNGHVIVSHDHFVALPSTRALTCNGCYAKEVRVCSVATGRCETAPVWDVGPWNTRDDYWNPGSVRENWNDLPQGTPEAQAAYYNGYHWLSNCKNLDGSYSGHGGGSDQFGRCVLNPAGIDLADGTIWDGLGMSGSGWVDVTFLWVADPAPSDTTPPVTTSSLSGAQGQNGWWVSPVTVSLSASDPSGIRATYARIDGGGWFGYGGPFAVGGDGGHTVYYYSVDGAGNTEGVRAVGFSIDTTPPSTSASLSGTPGTNGWWRSSVSVTLNAFDGMSGVAGTTAIRDGAVFGYGGPFGVAGEGVHGVNFRSSDRAGNVEGWRGVSVAIDTQPPSTSFRHGEPSWQGSNALFVTSSTPLSLTATDATSGIASSTWSWNGQGGNGAFTLRGADAAADLSYRSVDRAGNTEASKALRLALDNTPPALSLDQPPANSVVASLDAVHLAPVTSDTGSGMDHVDYLLDGQLRARVTIAPYAWDWQAGDEHAGRHVLSLLAVDHVGNTARLDRNETTVPTSVQGAEATAAWAQGLPAQQLATLPPPPSVPALPALPTLPALPAPLPALPKLPTLPILPAVPAVPGLPSAPAVPSRLPVVGVVADVDPATGSYRVGATDDGVFLGAEGRLPVP